MGNNKIARQSKETDFTLPEEKPSAARGLVAAIRKSGLIGMWNDRTDIKDSVEFARKLRNRASKRKIDKGDATA